MSIKFYLSFNNGVERIQLPVNPAKITINSAFGYNDVQVSQLGEYTIPGEASLKEIAFESFFPRDYNPVYCDTQDLSSPWEYVETLERWRASRKPMRLTITGTPINYAVTLRELTYDAEKAANIGDIYYSLTFKEFKFVTVRKYTEQTENSKVVVRESVASSRPTTEVAPKTHTVAKGDTLSKIALKYKLADWRPLYEKNKSVIGKNPNLIKPGQVLTL